MQFHRLVLDLLRLHYVPTTTANAQDPPAFSDVEVLYILEDESRDERECQLEEFRTFVASYGFELSVVSASEIYRKSTLAVSLDSKGRYD